MSREINLICAIFFLLKYTNAAPHLAKIAPEDVSAGLTVIYGFAPRLKLGNDQRVGFGFRFGNHADFQILYEFGPQTITAPPQAIKTRSAPVRHYTRKPRRRPLIELLIRTGLLREVERVEKPRNSSKKQTNLTKVKA